MSLREILQKLVAEDSPVLLCDNSRDWEAGQLLENLSSPMLKRRAYLQAGLYIAEISETGYLGQVLYRLKRK